MLSSMKRSAATLLVLIFLLLTGTIFSPALLAQSNMSGNGSSTASPSPAPKMAFYLTPDCSTVVNAYCQNTPADSVEFNDCNWTAAATDVNCVASHFTSADVGKNIMGAGNCGADNQGIGSANGTGGQIATATAVTVASFISGTHITLSGIPANAVVSNGCIILGHLDDTGAAALDTLMQAAATCPKLFLAAANYFFSSPHFFTNPAACAAIGPGQATQGTTTLPAGFEIEGRGVGPTTLWMNSNFPNGDACTHKPPPATTGGCWVIPLMGKWSGFRLDGGGQHTAPNLNNLALITMAVGTLENFTCTNMGWKGTNSIGINMALLSQLYQVNNAGCGAIGLQAEGQLSSGFRVFIENSATRALNMPGNTSGTDTFTCYFCEFALPSSGSANTQVILNGGGILKLIGSQVYSGNNTSSNTGITGYKCTGATGVLYSDMVVYSFANGGAANDDGSLWNSVSGCQIKIRDSQITAQSAGGLYFDVAGAIYNDLGGNIYTGAFFNTNGTYIADSHSLTGTCTGVATASSTLGLYGTGPNATTTTCTSATIGSGVVMTQARTLAPLKCNSSATTVSVACTVLVNGVASALTCTMTAATACNDGTHQVAVSPRDLISLRIVTGVAETGANIEAFVMWY